MDEDLPKAAQGRFGSSFPEGLVGNGKELFMGFGRPGKTANEGEEVGFLWLTWQLFLGKEVVLELAQGGQFGRWF